MEKTKLRLSEMQFLRLTSQNLEKTQNSLELGEMLKWSNSLYLG